MTEPKLRISLLGYTPTLPPARALHAALKERAKELQIHECGELIKPSDGPTALLDRLEKLAQSSDLLVMLWHTRTAQIRGQEKVLLDLVGSRLSVTHILLEECRLPTRYGRHQMINISQGEHDDGAGLWAAIADSFRGATERSSASESLHSDSVPKAAQPLDYFELATKLATSTNPPSDPRAVYDVFISYKREDQKLAEKVYAFLSQKHRVWWDRQLEVDRGYDVQLEERLLDAKAVVVLWTANAVREESFVRDEAHDAYRQGKLISVVASPCKVPLPFNRHQAIRLVGWNPEMSRGPGKELLRRIELVHQGLAPPLEENALATAASSLLTTNSWAGAYVPPPRPDEDWTRASRTELRPPRKLLGQPKTPELHRWCVAGGRVYLLAKDESGLHRLHVDTSEGTGRRYFTPSGGDPDGVQDVCAIPNSESYHGEEVEYEDFATVGLRRSTAWFESDRGHMSALRFGAAELRGDGTNGYQRIHNREPWPFERIQSNHQSGDYYHDSFQEIVSTRVRDYLAMRVGLLEEGAEAGKGWKIRFWAIGEGASKESDFDVETKSCKSGKLVFSATGNFCSFGVASSHEIVDVRQRSIADFPSDSGYQPFGQVVWHPVRDVYAVAAFDESERARGNSIWRIELWDASSRSMIFSHELRASKGFNFGAWSPDGRYLVFSTQEGTVHLYDLKEDKDGLLHAGGKSMAYHLEFSPNGERLAVFGLGERSRITIWDHANETLVATLGGTFEKANGSCWRRDSSTLIFEVPERDAIEEWGLA